MIRKFFRLLLSLPVIVGALGVAGVLLVITFGLLYFLAPANPTAGVPTAALTIIPASSSTPELGTQTPIVPPSPTSDLPPSPLPGMIGLGSFVQIFGTEGSALNIRVSAGLGTDVRFLAYEAEVFEVRDGPVEIDGITWWYLVTPVDENRTGWAASNYLSVVPNP